MPLDPNLWGNMPGQGRAPLQPAYQPSQAASDPMADIARRLVQSQGGGGPMDPRERPQAFAPDPATLSPQQLQGFHEGYGGFGGPSSVGRGPGAVAGGITTLAGAPTLGLGTALGYAGNRGVKEYHGKLESERMHQMANAMEGGRGQMGDQRAIAPPRDPFADAYERGRQAAGGQSRDQRDIGRSQQASPGLSRSEDRDVGWGGA